MAIEDFLTFNARNWEERVSKEKLHIIQMDDLGYFMGAFLLQTGSEFLDMVNHYLLKEMEVGIFKALEHQYMGEKDRRMQFGILEPDHENQLETPLPNQLDSLTHEPEII